MNRRPAQSFAFHANAYALGANFHRPAMCQIEALAATSLPIIGGHAQACATDYCTPRLVRFRSAHSHVSGSFQDEHTATTQAITTIVGLNIMDVITADRITARLTSEHNLAESEGHILAIGSSFENLRIAGFTFNIVLRHELLMDSKTHEQLASKVESLRDGGRIANQKGKVVLCSLVEEIKTDFPMSEKDKKKHIVHIPHFGTISFAEVISFEGLKTITMLRFDLGSPDGGTGTACGATSNGKPMPPIP
ncbi:MAG: choice-of-anchor P family protein [Candidatus Acidiferrum sp.]